MTAANIGAKVTAKHKDVSSSEKEIFASLADDEHAKAQARIVNAAAADQEKLTELKETYASAILCFLWFWCAALFVMVTGYFVHQVVLGQAVPKEVIISIFTCTAVVVGLVGYILKGLFGSQ